MTTEIAADQLSSYLAYLPAIFQQSEENEDATAEPLFLGRFLLAFEHLLSGLDDEHIPGLLERVEGSKGKGGLERYFRPRPGRDQNDAFQAPEEFLPWLARWVALTLREEWDVEEQRRMISQIVPLYRLRGTKEGLSALLSIYTSGPVTIEDQFDDFPHFFRVQLELNESNTSAPQDEIKRKERIARAIIDQEKPAHTYYALNSKVRNTMQIGKRSTIGQDTLLGSYG
jgi:P2-related tail formation protein